MEEKEKSNVWRIGLFVLFIAFLLYLKFSFNITAEDILNYTPENIFLAVMVFFLIFALKSVTIVFYIKIIYIAAGLVFPLPLAIFVNTVGTMLEISIPYFMGKSKGIALANKLYEKYPKISAFRKKRDGNDFLFSLLIRMMGVLPADIVSLYLGASSTPYYPYLFGGILGFLPSIIIATVLGESMENPSSSKFYVSLLLYAGVILLSLICSFVMNKRTEKNNKE